MARQTKAKTAAPKGTMAADSMQNLVTGMGTDKDKTFNTFFTLGLMDRPQMDAAYRGDWISRKAVDIPAEDATREWREWQADPDDVEAIETLEKDLGIQRKVKAAMQRGRLYGGGALVLGVNQGKPGDELILDSLDKDCLQFVHVVSRFELSNGPMIWDIESPYYGEPEYWTQSNQTTSAVQIHPSRVVRFIGNEIPDIGQANGWGDSILQSVTDAIIAAGSVSGSIAQLVAEAKLDVIKIPGLSENITNAAYEARLKKRFSFANISKSVYGILLLDKEEEWERMESQFNGLPDIEKLFLLIASGAVDIPATRFLGQSPQGLSATGDGDLRNYYDGVTSKQKNEVQPALTRLDEVLIRSALGKMPDEGEGDHGDIFYNWRPLWAMTPEQKATVAKNKADTFKIDVDAGLINEVVLKKAREAQLIEDGTYPGLAQLIEEFDDDPELEAVEPDPITGLLPPITDPNDPNYDPAADPNSPEFQKALPAPGEQKLLPAPSKKPKAKVAPKGKANPAVDGMVRRIKDATTPRTLYVRRDLLPSSQKKVKAWAKKAGFPSSLVDMHVTIAYSKEPVDWLTMGEDYMSNGDSNGNLTVKAGGPRVLEKFGKAVVLAFANSDLTWRWRSMKDRGATWSYDDYTPHVTISYQAGDIDHLRIRPYDGELEFGPEIFEEIKTGFNNEVHTVEDNDAEVVEDGVSPFGDEFNPNQPRETSGPHGGQWTKSPTSGLKGTSAERVAMRKQLQNEPDPEKRKELKERILASFVKQYKKKPSPELEANIAKYSKLYGKPNPLKELSAHAPTPVTPAFGKPSIDPNIPVYGKTPPIVTMPKPGPVAPAVHYTPEEQAAFKDLSEMSGSTENAKAWMAAGHKRKVGTTLSGPEAAHIVAYSGNAYRQTNAQLRAGKLSPATYRHSKALTKALEKLPAHEGTVYRKANLSPEAFKKYQPGSVTIERGFTSTSTVHGTWSGDYHYQIKSKTGRNIKNLSSHPGENEVLFVPNTGFRVTHVSGNTIHMEEFDE